jgi:hypothetical protein
MLERRVDGSVVEIRVGQCKNRKKREISRGIQLQRAIVFASWD